jgi:hypothetical protein
MKIKELIQHLSHFDPNLRVVAPGFDESNLEDIDAVELIRVVFYDEKRKFHGGRHKESQDGVQAVKIDWQ